MNLTLHALSQTVIDNKIWFFLLLVSAQSQKLDDKNVEQDVTVVELDLGDISEEDEAAEIEAEDEEIKKSIESSKPKDKKQVINGCLWWTLTRDMYWQIWKIVSLLFPIYVILVRILWGLILKWSQ